MDDYIQDMKVSKDTIMKHPRHQPVNIGDTIA